ncbi:MAG TPA: formate transporter [Gammaproteobacteria bacterium]|jgi:formate/nitrite transporter|nr:formate transporter [Gammaproteobacteria bacterium]|tara:strand:+ start:1046 stop:1891 length:846 start_codon:yes stop_codon:yes gene_type:complete
MSYLVPTDVVEKMVIAGAVKMNMTTRTTVIRAIMAGAILGLAAVFAITVAIKSGSAVAGAVLFPVGFIMLILFGYDLLTGVVVLGPLAVLAKRNCASVKKMWRLIGLVFIGNFIGAASVAVMMSFIWTFGFSIEPGVVASKIATIGESRTVGYAAYGAMGFATVFIKAMLCNWMVSLGVIGAMMSKDLMGKILAMWMPIMLFFYMGFEHSIVNMFLFPAGLIMGGEFSIIDYFVWNEIPVILGNVVGGLVLTGLPLYYAHKRSVEGKIVSSEFEEAAVALR